MQEKDKVIRELRSRLAKYEHENRRMSQCFFKNGRKGRLSLTGGSEEDGPAKDEPQVQTPSRVLSRSARKKSLNSIVLELDMKLGAQNLRYDKLMEKYRGLQEEHDILQEESRYQIEQLGVQLQQQQQPVGEVVHEEKRDHGENTTTAKGDLLETEKKTLKLIREELDRREKELEKSRAELEEGKETLKKREEEAAMNIESQSQLARERESEQEREREAYRAGEALWQSERELLREKLSHVEQDLVEVRDRESALEEERVKVRETSVAMERARELEREAEREHIKMLESQVEQETEKSKTVQMEKENLGAQFVQLNEQFDNMLGMYKDIQSQLEAKEAEMPQLRESLEEAMMKARDSHQSTLPVNVPCSSSSKYFFSHPCIMMPD